MPVNRTESDPVQLNSHTTDPCPAVILDRVMWQDMVNMTNPFLFGRAQLTSKFDFRVLGCLLNRVKFMQGIHLGGSYGKLWTSQQEAVLLDSHKLPSSLLLRGPLFLFLLLFALLPIASEGGSWTRRPAW